jgi:hypothetical protein
VAQIFISYSKKDPQPTRDVAAFLEREGYSVWWDADLTSGQAFGDIIDKELDTARAAIVIWTIDSVKSKWVRAEARHADRHEKLIPLRTKDLEIWQIPKPFSEYHTDLVDDREAILKAVRRLAGLGGGDDEFERGVVYDRLKPPPEPGRPRRLLDFAVATILSVVALVTKIRRVPWAGPVFFLICLLAFLFWIGVDWYSNGSGTSTLSDITTPIQSSEAATSTPPSVPLDANDPEILRLPYATGRPFEPPLPRPPASGPVPDRNEIAALLARARTYLSASPPDVAAGPTILSCSSVSASSISRPTRP